ncbi:hypothetical protein [Methanoregula sp.]|uniref:hypothetical protein n=1 Tax=Methanoregula sp. TaxID=2052170 RepID=UPI002B66AEAE|nr:hypothetical protein [Methanoregula sp.]HVP97626.1 hypothetical protein [Methanoregula sp.]
MAEFEFTSDQIEKLKSWENILNTESVKKSLEDLSMYMINEESQTIRVMLPREDIDRIQQLKKPVSDFCRDAVHERLNVIRMSEGNFILEEFRSGIAHG